MDAKLKWWEKKSAKTAGTKDKETTSNENAAAAEEGQGEGAGADDPSAARPGAVAVRGPEYRGSDFDDTSTVPGGGGGGGGGGSAGGGDDEAPLHVDSYLVHEPPTDEEIRQRILAGTAHAEAVDKVEPSEPPPRCHSPNQAVGLLFVVVVVVAAIAVGVAVSLSKQQPRGPSTEHRDENVVASYKFLALQGSGGFANAIFAEKRKVTESVAVTSGAEELIHCRPKICLESDTNCLTGYEFFAPGCCAEADCPNETKCGQLCPEPPESCYLTDPTNMTCIRSECYTCKDAYVLTDYAFTIDCLEVGTAIRPENGLEYKWAIFCGPVTLGPIVEQNRDLGEYQCEAARLGAYFSDDDGGLLAFTTPCQFIALAECGCGPSDMYTFGLPAPTGPCRPDGCPILCEGVGGGNEYARNLCRSFPGNISWWEGRNAFNASQFTENTIPQEYELEIYIKGVD